MENNESWGTDENLIYKRDKERRRGIKVGKGGKRKGRNPCTCSSQLCCAYSESLLHPERLLSVSFRKLGFIAKEGAAADARVHMWVCVCEEAGRWWVAGGRYSRCVWQHIVKTNLAPYLSAYKYEHLVGSSTRHCHACRRG